MFDTDDGSSRATTTVLVRFHLDQFLFPLFAFLAQSVGFALVVVVDDLQPEIAVALDERGPDVRDVVAPPAAEGTVHVVLLFVVLEPIELLEPVRPETATLAGGCCGGGVSPGAGRLAGCLRFGVHRRRANHLYKEGFLGGCTGTCRSTGWLLLLLLLKEVTVEVRRTAP